MHPFVFGVRVLAGPRLHTPAGAATYGPAQGSYYYWVTSKNLIEGGLMILSCPARGSDPTQIATRMQEAARQRHCALRFLA